MFLLRNRPIMLAVCLLHCTHSLAETASRPTQRDATSYGDHTNQTAPKDFRRRDDQALGSLAYAEIQKAGYANLGKLVSDMGTSTALQSNLKGKMPFRRVPSYEWTAENFEERDVSAEPRTLQELAELIEIIWDNADGSKGRGLPLTGLPVGQPEGAVRMMSFRSWVRPYILSALVEGR